MTMTIKLGIESHSSQEKITTILWVKNDLTVFFLSNTDVYEHVSIFSINRSKPLK